MKKDRQAASPRWTEAELDQLVEEATMDCYDESEQVFGLYTMLEDNLVLPFETTLLGATLSVERIDLTDREVIVAFCKRGIDVRKLRLIDVPLTSPPPEGAEWIAAYRHWLGEESSAD